MWTRQKLNVSNKLCQEEFLVIYLQGIISSRREANK
jgi:hypothetical protein